jgi:hypothetical protein
VTATLEDTRAFVESRGRSTPERRLVALEVLAVLASPVVLYYCLRLRGMAPPGLPDPAMHTTYIVDPHDIFQRYEALFTPTARLREAARVGFLVPGRLSYLLFGAVPGFFVYRYLLALVAIVPAYVLLKRLYGRWAGFLAIVVIVSSPVVLTAWGTDYPDSAAVSYLTGGLAALALWWHSERGRSGWLMLTGVLLTFAVWSHGVAVPLVAALLIAFVAVRLWGGHTQVLRELLSLARDLTLLAASALVVTGLLAVGSGLLLGQYNFIGPTIQSAKILTRASMLHADHSVSWSWAPYVNYLLVPPAVVLAFVVVFARTRRTIAPAKLFLGLAGCLQLALFVYLQFFSSLQALEMHYFSSMLWSSVNLLLVVVLAEVARPALGRLAAGVLPALLVIAVILAYEGALKLGWTSPAMTWVPGGAILVATVIAASALGGLAARRAALGAASIVVIAAASLVLTVARGSPHGPLANTVYDPIPTYADALDGSGSAYVSQYQVLSKLPGFVGHAAYKGEVLLTWAPPAQFGYMQGPLGIFHNAFTFVNWTFPVLGKDGAHRIGQWRVPQVLLMSLTGQDFARAVRALDRFAPVVVRRAVISNGWYHLHVWLVDLRSYIRPATA